ncbi:hypothetical protein VPNG_07422 [Cytospora leucostoma]|uniref:DUF4045 domain-containing protein n=1 Tax=Cytospora leucostoma TaxID=1230097 RepID=A0A423WMW1_9PEZI|nr:hypothetical protein VPNG_07422 [Cytospora leucostoma]
MSNEVSDFLRSVEQLNHRRDEEEEARSRELEEKLLQQRKERQARREERARSISPQKSSPANTPPPSARRKDSTSQGTEEPSSIPALSAALQNQTSTVTSPPADAMDLSSIRSTSPTRETVFDQESKRTSFASSPSSAVTTKSPALSWQRRPPSQGPERPRSRPLSIVAAENAAARSNTTSAEATSTNQPASRDEISQALASKDPAWFRQTADRGANSAAYRKNQVEDSDTVNVLSARTQLPGMSHPTPPEVEEERGEPPLERPLSQASLGTTASPLPLTDAQKLGPASGQSSPTRPASPTKGTGGFVQSAMMKRTDSVKRWSVTTPGLQRLGNAGNRHSFDGSNSPGPEPTRPVSRSKDSFPRPSSSHGKDLPPVDASLPNDHVAEVAKLEIADDRTPPTTPSRTMDPKRWSPTKGSWLDAALNKPESPKPKPAAPSNQPAWMVELNRAKAERAKNASVDLGRSGSIAKKHEVKTGGLVRPAPLGTSVKPSSFSGLPSPSLASERPLTPGLRGNLNKTSPALEKPVLEHPILKKPSLEKPGLEKPIAEKPTEATVSEEPVPEEPIPEKPVPEKPVPVKPVFEKFKFERSKFEKPSFEKPALEKPGFIEHPILRRTGSAKPAPEKPIAEKPTETPVSEEPVPEEPISEKSIPEKPVPAKPVFEKFKFERSKFEKPSFEKPALEKPGFIEHPILKRTGFPKPVPEKPVAEKPTPETPVPEEPVAEKPALETPVPEEPVPEEPVPEEPVLAEPSVEKHSLDKSVLEKPVLETPVLEKPSFEKLSPGTTEPERRGSVTNPAPEQEKADTLPIKDFRAGLRPRGTTIGRQDLGRQENKEPENELANVFGKLRRAKTQNFVPSDELKNNILKGKTALNATGGPKPYEKKDDFKDALLKKRADFEKAKEEGRSIDPAAKAPQEQTVPEGLAKRAEISRSGSISQYSHSRDNSIAKSPSEFSARPFDSSRFSSISNTPSPTTGDESALVKEEKADAAPIPTLPSQEKNLPGRLPNKLGGNALAERFNPALAGLLARGPPGIGGEATKSPGMKASPGVAETAKEPGPGPKLEHMTKNRARGPRRKAPTSLLNPAEQGDSEPAALASSVPETQEPVVKDVEAKSPLSSPEPVTEAPTVKAIDAESPSRSPSPPPESEEPAVKPVEAEIPSPPSPPPVTEREEPVLKGLEAKRPLPSPPAPEAEEPVVEHTEAESRPSSPTPADEEPAVKHDEAEFSLAPPVNVTEEPVVENFEAKRPLPSLPAPEAEEPVVEDSEAESPLPSPIPATEEPIVEEAAIQDPVSQPVPELEEVTVREVQPEAPLFSAAPEIEEPVAKDFEAESSLPSAEPKTEESASGAESRSSSPVLEVEEPFVKDSEAEVSLPSPVPDIKEPFMVKDIEAEISLPSAPEVEEPVVKDIKAEVPLPSPAPEIEEAIAKDVEAEVLLPSASEIEEPVAKDIEAEVSLPSAAPEIEEPIAKDVEAEVPLPSTPEIEEPIAKDIEAEVSLPSAPEVEEPIVKDIKTEAPLLSLVPEIEEPVAKDVEAEVSLPSAVPEIEEPVAKDIEAEISSPSIPEVEEPVVKDIKTEVPLLSPAPEIEEPVAKDVDVEFPSPPVPTQELEPEPMVSPKPIVRSPTVSPVELFKAKFEQDQPRDNNLISPVEETKRRFTEQQISTGTNIALVDSSRPRIPTPGSPSKIHEQVAAITAKTLPAEDKKADEPPQSPRKLDKRRMSKFLDEASVPSPKFEPEPVRSPSPVKRIGGPRSPRKLPEPAKVESQPAPSMGNGSTSFGRPLTPLKPQIPTGEPIPAPLNLRPRSKTKTLTSRDLPPLPNKELPALPSRELPALPARGLPALPSSPSRELPPLPTKALPALTSRELPALPSTPVQASPIASPTRSPSKSAKDVSAMLNGFFGNERPKRNYRVDAVEVLMHRPKSGSLVQTQKAQLFQVTEQGKKIPVPAHHERVLFEREMYICPHTFINDARKKTTEVYFWVGDEVASSVVRDAQVFVNREARSMGGTLVNIRQGKETAEFIQALGGLVIIRRGSSNKYDSLAPNILCGRQYMGQVVFDEVDFAPNTLCSGFPYLITQQGRCYLWKGKGCGIDEVSCSKLVGMDLALMGELVEIEEDQEPEAFWSLFGGARKESSADHWRLKAGYDKYCGRLFRSESADPRQIVEISPFSQSDLSPAKIYVLDAFFEMYIIIGREAQSQYTSFHNALDFAQEYAILAAGMEDRPFVPVSTVVLEGIPRDLRSCFRKWRDDRSPTKMLPSSRNSVALIGAAGGNMSGLKRARSLKVLPLGQALQALGNSE